MENVLVESAIRGTLIAAGVSMVLWAARIKAPAVLHAAWTGVVLALLSLPLWTFWGPKAPVSVFQGRPNVASTLAQTQSMDNAPRFAVSSPIGGAGITADRAPQAAAVASRASVISWPWRTIALVIYVVVAATLLARLGVGTVTACRLRRRARVRAGRLTSSACESPVTVGWLHPVVILPERWETWPPSQLDAVLTHEQAHMRRRDPLAQWLALLHRAVFWFSPVSWWLERRLSALAEQSCDDVVLARGHDPKDYSAYLLDLARAIEHRARVNLAGTFMPGVFLPQRIRRILDGTPAARVSSVRLGCVAAVCIATIAVGAGVQPVRALQQVDLSRTVVRPLQARWISPESTRPQPVSLEWLDGDEWAFEVQSIVTSDELREYSELRVPQERDAFIARFWSRRDPTPDTPQNEYREEFTRRIRYARDRFGDPNAAGTFGFDTDRGRVYLMFGEPDAVDRADSGGLRDVWRYDAVTGMSSGLTVRFLPSRGSHCSHRIVSPAPLRTIEGAETVAQGRLKAAPTDRAATAPQTTVQLYPHGLTAISIGTADPTATGARWELRNQRGDQMDEGQIGFLDGNAAARPLAEHLPPGWLDDGVGCTHALPPDSYTLTTAVRFTSGQLQRDTLTFVVQ